MRRPWLLLCVATVGSERATIDPVDQALRCVTTLASGQIRATHADLENAGNRQWINL